MEIPGLFSPGAISGSAGDSAASLADDFDTFLQLLTTQLQHQDPLDPMDSNQFVEQLVSFTEVEQSIETNQSLEELIALQSSNQAVAALGLMGETVEVQSDSGMLTNDGTTFTYTLPSSAASTQLLIANESGQTVHLATGNNAAGKHVFAWDGTDTTGVPLPNGVYRFTVAARDSQNEIIETSTGVIGIVDGVESSDSGVQLSINGLLKPVDKVVSVVSPPSQTN